MRKACDLRILVFGATGQVGRELPASLSEMGVVTALDRAQGDLSQPESLRAVVRQHQPHVIVNAAAYTAVDRAESEPELAHAVNAIAPGVLAEEAEKAGACMVHYSTDYVFDGTKPVPYVETDPTNPLSVYGRTKLAGERAVAAAIGRHLIFRTSWVFAEHGANFLRTILRLAAERETMSIVADQRGVPTPASLIAAVTAEAIGQSAGARATGGAWGVYHVVPAGATTWHAYARYLVERAAASGVPLKVKPEAIAPLASAEYPTKATRPANSLLDTSRLRSTFSIDLPHWTQGVNDVIVRLANQ